MPAAIRIPAPHILQDQQPKEYLSLPFPGLRPVCAGLPRGAISEITGGRSTGRTALLLAAVAQATAAGEVCAWVDAAGAFDPASAESAGVDLRRLLWIRANGQADRAFRAADQVLHSGGFGVVVLDLCEMADRDLRRVPLSYWYRFRRAVEGTSSLLAVAADAPVVGTCASVQLESRRREAIWREPYTLLDGAVWEVGSRKPFRAPAEVPARARSRRCTPVSMYHGGLQTWAVRGGLGCGGPMRRLCRNGRSQ